MRDNVFSIEDKNVGEEGSREKESWGTFPKAEDLAKIVSWKAGLNVRVRAYLFLHIMLLEKTFMPWWL